MPLTHSERAFLDAYVYEATHEPFGGPATRDLRQRGISYNDLHWLLTAYDREMCAEGQLPTGQKNPSPPPSPWTDLAQVKLRNEVLREEFERQETLASNGESTMPSTRKLQHSVLSPGERNVFDS